MAHVNETRKEENNMVVNEMGSLAYQLDDIDELVATVLTTFMEDSYYESAKDIQKRIINKLDVVDPLFCAKLAVYLRTNANMRSVSHFIAAYIARHISGNEWAKRLYEKLVVRPDDIAEIIAWYAKLNDIKTTGKQLKKLPNSMKKGFKSSLEKLDAYQIDKYKMERRNISLVDVVNLLHPNTKDNPNAEAFKRLVNDESLKDLYDSKIFEKEFSNVGQNASSEKEKTELKGEVLRNMLNSEKGMPIFNLIRNLRNILLYAPDQTDKVCELLTDKKRILNSKLLPFRFVSAFKEIDKLKKDETISFESADKPVKQILDALNTAIEYSCENIPELSGNVAILCDDSGSMRGDMGGESLVSKFSKTKTSTIGHLFAAMLSLKQRDVYVGLFGDRLLNAKYDRSKSVLENTVDFDKLGYKCGPATESGIYEFFRGVIREERKVDNIVIFSDCQIGKTASTDWYGIDTHDRSKTFQGLIKDFKKINPSCNIIVVNLHQVKGNNIIYKKQNILNIAGWSDKIFDVISSMDKGFTAIIKEINKIEI